MSKILLINPDWQNKDKELPQKFVVKILTQLVIQKFSKQASEQRNLPDRFADEEFMPKFATLQKLCHNAEVTVYKQLAKIPSEKLSVPKVLRYKAILEASTLDMAVEDRKCLIENPFTNVFGSIFRKEISHFGCSATDLVRVFSACLSGKDRQEKWEYLLEQFYGYLKEEVGDRKMPYTLEQLKESYRRFFPIGAFLVAPMIGPLYDAIFKSPDEDKKKKCLEIITEKTRCLVDDILDFHDRNKVIKDAIRDGVIDVANENQ
ncbi:unnamed protein product [Nippostrongylus brasiliensis]|uniref:CHK domain-containing protein n=1 Tax=Nippostrongylus brasiliensis TaxID=27835 RepID=A0A0N4XTG6_NIPBR|nr:unnamed protein product [Nippostrongylus brasiliensis]